MIESSHLLRPDLLEGISVLLAGPTRLAAAHPTGTARAVGIGGMAECLPGAIGATCAELGARVAVWEVAGEVGDVDMLVVDSAGLFARGGGDGAAEPVAPRGALSACLEGTWEATREVVNGALLPAGRAGRIVYLAPAGGRGPFKEHADAARAGLENLGRTLSIEWARHGITLVTVAPGERTTAGEVAALCAYLASPAGAYFSGCLLDLRGP
jgi:NAD(P)-dependent dehydrogenase (short-subunit alcohol dehydrogenase family)